MEQAAEQDASAYLALPVLGGVQLSSAQILIPTRAMDAAIFDTSVGAIFQAEGRFDGATFQGRVAFSVFKQRVQIEVGAVVRGAIGVILAHVATVTLEEWAAPLVCCGGGIVLAARSHHAGQDGWRT